MERWAKVVVIDRKVEANERGGDGRRGKDRIESDRHDKCVGTQNNGHVGTHVEEIEVELVVELKVSVKDEVNVNAKVKKKKHAK